MIRKAWVFTALVLVVSFQGVPLWAEDSAALDHASQEALQKTMDLLKQPQLRAGALKDKGAGQADQQLRGLVGDEDAEKTYQLASQIFEDMVKSAHGDVSALAAQVEEAQRHPEKFALKLTPEQRQELLEIAHRHEGANPPSH
jgi:hypothetical protein